MTRRDRNAQATRRDVIQAARELFATQPYGEVTATQICAHAGVTRGALQHHFGNKTGLFEAVFESMTRDVVARITAVLGRDDDPWALARAAIVTFLDACTDAEYQAVVLKEAPAAIGWHRWRELDSKHFAGIIGELTDAFAAAGLITHSPVMVAAALRGAFTELAFAIVWADDQQRARADALAVIDTLMSSFGGRLDLASAT